MSEEDQRQYEFIFILSPELGEKDVNSFEQEIEKDIKNLGGNLKNKGKPEKRDLAYPIKKFQSAYYLAVNSLFNPEKIKELLEIFKHKKEVLRFIITFVEEPSTAIAKKVKKSKKNSQPKAGPPEAEKVDKLEEIVREVTEEEVEAVKKIIKKKKEKKKEVKLEEIDKKLEEILGI